MYSLDCTKNGYVNFRFDFNKKYTRRGNEVEKHKEQFSLDQERGTRYTKQAPSYNYRVLIREHL